MSLPVAVSRSESTEAAHVIGHVSNFLRVRRNPSWARIMRDVVTEAVDLSEAPERPESAAEPAPGESFHLGMKSALAREASDVGGERLRLRPLRRLRPR